MYIIILIILIYSFRNLFQYHWEETPVLSASDWSFFPIVLEFPLDSTGVLFGQY